MNNKNSPNKLFVSVSDKTVKDYVRKILCLQDGESGCECEACKAFSEGKNIDVFMLNPAEDEQIPVSDFREKLNSFFGNCRNMSSKKVLLIYNMEFMNEVSQNTLLKFIEDNNDRVVFVASANDESKVLSTVKSRLVIVKNEKMVAFESFQTYCYSRAIGQAELYYALTGGDVLKIEEVGRCMNIWKDIIKYLPDKTYKEKVFSILHLVKEKDKEAFTELHPECSDALLKLMQQVFFSCLQHINHDQSLFDVSDCNWTIEELFENILYLDSEIENVQKKHNLKTKDLTSLLIKIYKN